MNMWRPGDLCCADVQMRGNLCCVEVQMHGNLCCAEVQMHMLLRSFLLGQKHAREQAYQYKPEIQYWLKWVGNPRTLSEDVTQHDLNMKEQVEILVYHIIKM